MRILGLSAFVPHTVRIA